MTLLDDLLTTLPEQHRKALLWFHERQGQEIPWPEPLDGELHLVNHPKGIHKPAGWKYALSVRQTLNGPYADEEPVFQADGTWTYRYFQEQKNPNDRDNQFTNVALLACMDDRVPVGVLRQTRLKPSVRYQIMGLAFVTGWEDGYFVLRGLTPEAAVAQ